MTNGDEPAVKSGHGHPVERAKDGSKPIGERLDLIEDQVTGQFKRDDIRLFVNAEVSRIARPWKWAGSISAGVLTAFLGVAAFTFKGPQGDRGSEGPAGRDGSQGLLGPQGAIGSRGDRGEQGPQGVPGLGADVGSIVAWPVMEVPPVGWRVCNGDVLDAIEFRALAQLLGATYGAIGPDKVKLPNFRGMFLRGYAPDNGELGAEQPESVGKHNHFSFRKERVTGNNSADLTPEVTPSTIREHQSHPYTIVGRTEPTGQWVGVTGHNNERVADENRPANYAVHWIIRVK